MSTSQHQATESAVPSEPATRTPLRAVALPTEHGGWGLTGEPILLGLAVAPSFAGLCLGIAAMVAFLARTPLRIVLVDRHRQRDLDRTVLARRVLIGELALLASLVVAAALTTTDPFWWPAAIAAPLVIAELWFDTRSRSRRLVPELAGALGICSVAAMIIIAGGEPTNVAVAAWMVLAGRAITSIPHVRYLVARIHGRSSSTRVLFVSDLVAAGLVVGAAVVEPPIVAGSFAVLAVMAIQRLTAPRQVPAKVTGIRQTIFGLVVVAASAISLQLT